MSEDLLYWDVSGPRRYLNIPTPVPDRWRVALTDWHHEVVAWGPTEEAAKSEAIRLLSEKRSVGQRTQETE